VARLRIVLVVLAISGPTAAAAQTSEVTGHITGHLGVGHGGDIQSAGLTVGGTLAVLEADGWGAEVELGHTTRFANELFDESGITTAMVNALGMWPHPTVRPFGAGGVGVIRVRASGFGDEPSLTRTDWGLNLGGGVLVMLNDAVGIRGDVRYFRYFQRHDDLPLTNGGFFDFWRSSVGVTWTWPIS
jgi:hypothetical protein